MNLRHEIRAFVDAHTGEPDQLAELFIRGCEKDDLLPLLSEHIRAVLRSQVRIAEIEALHALPTHHGEAALDAGLAALLNEPYWIGDGQARRFGALTAEEHQTRITMLQATVAGIARNIALHEEAISLIVSRNVSCLDELNARARAA